MSKWNSKFIRIIGRRKTFWSPVWWVPLEGVERFDIHELNRIMPPRHCNPPHAVSEERNFSLKIFFFSARFGKCKNFFIWITASGGCLSRGLKELTFTGWTALFHHYRIPIMVVRGAKHPTLKAFKDFSINVLKHPFIFALKMHGWPPLHLKLYVRYMMARGGGALWTEEKISIYSKKFA